MKIICFSDASFANLMSGSLQGSFIIFMCNSGKYAPKAWKSNKLNRLVKSSLSLSFSFYLSLSLFLSLLGLNNNNNNNHKIKKKIGEIL